MNFYIFNIFILFYISLIENSHGDCPQFKGRLNNSNETINPVAPSSNSNVSLKTFERIIDNVMVYGRIIYVHNANSSLEVLQPKNDENGCAKRELAKTSYTAALAENCEVATNAGFFNTHTKECVGNLINNRKIYINSGGIKNANFGIKNDGKLFFGYLGAEDVVKGDFRMLVGGVIWLLKNNASMVNESIAQECRDSQESGSLRDLASISSARTAVGATKDGTVVIVHIEGKSSKGGVNLWQFTEILQSLRVVSAINFDGGGSATLVVNNTVISYPTDGCSIFSCERPVSTILCVRAKHSRPTNGSASSDVLWNYSTSTTVLLIAAILFLVFVVVVISWIIRRQARKEFSKKINRLVFNDDDDLVHFDLKPLMEDVDSVEEI